MPHQLLLPLEPFKKWGLDFVGPFKPAATQTWNRYILMDTDYLRKWVKAKVLHRPQIFSYKKLHCFVCPIELIRDQGGHFIKRVVQELMEHYTLYTRKSLLITLRQTGAPNRQIRHFRTSWRRLSMKTGRTGIQSCKAPYGPIERGLKQVIIRHHSD